MSLTRRTLLQRAGLASASLGLSQMGLALFGHRYQRALAAPTSRKLALLIGINTYPEAASGFTALKGPVLQGAVTDVELVKDVLIHRFGFHASDIVTLTDKQATRDNILAALSDHVLGQATSDDIVVFHGSGLGSYVKATGNGTPADSGNSDSLQPVFVPVDGLIPTTATADINDIPLETLALALGALPTSNVISVLDIGYHYPSHLLGNLRVRSRAQVPTGKIPEQLVALNQQWLGQQQTRVSDKGNLPSLASFPGSVFAAANDQGIAVETTWDGFSAGLLTYALVHKLWASPPTVPTSAILGQVRSTMERLVGQNHGPQFFGLQAISRLWANQLISGEETVGNADGVVTEVEADQKMVSLRLMGLPPLVFQYCAEASYFTVMAEASSPPTTGAPDTNADASTAQANTAQASNTNTETPQQWIQGRSRTALKVKARLCDPIDQNGEGVGSGEFSNSITANQFVYEAVRVIPKDIRLMVALGDQLERIERVDATSALSATTDMTSSIAGELHADCVFGKVAPPDSMGAQPLELGLKETDDASDATPDSNSVEQQYALFRPGRSIIPSTASQKEEAVKTAIRRLTPQLYGLLAEKLVQLTVNPGSSQLGVRATLDVIYPEDMLLGQQNTVRAPWQSPDGRVTKMFDGRDSIPEVSIDGQLQCRIQNYSDRPLYGILLNIDSRGDVTVLAPLTPENDDSESLDEILPGTIATVPSPAASFPWSISNALGLATIYVIVSCAPFAETLEALPQLMRPIDSIRRPKVISQPLMAARAILRDLHRASQATLPPMVNGNSGDRYVLDVGCWSTFSFTYNVVAPAPAESAT